LAERFGEAALRIEFRGENSIMQKRTLLKAVLASAAVAAAGNAIAAGPRTAVIYFTKTGHTKALAEAVRNFTGADLYRVETVKPYPEEYREATKVVKDELEKGVIRELKPLKVDLSAYDVIVLATPTWWHHVSMPLQTWIKGADLSGKKVLTANTHGGGGMMHTREDFEKLLPKSTLGTHLTVYGAPAPHDPTVEKWLIANGVI
jgi:flavodoxin